MPPKKSSPSTPQQRQQGQNARPKSSTDASKTALPEHEVKKSSSMSAQLALQATKKAYDLRQAAYGAGDPNAREEILAKAINKEIEAESFGKAAKYTRSGAFQGLAAGAGLGVQPGVTLGKVTGALVGGVVASLGAVVGGGIGSAYGAISGPFWNLGEIASQGVRSIVGDFPNWEATSSQKKALEKMVMGAQQTKAPSQDELEEMRDDDGGANEMDYQQFAQDVSAWIPSMPSMPSMPSLPGFGGWSQTKSPKSTADKTATTPAQSNQPKPSQTRKTTSTTSASQPDQTRQQATPTKSKPASKPTTTSSVASNRPTRPQQPNSVADEKPAKKAPKKLEVRSTSNTPQSEVPAPRRKPPKLGPRQKPVTAST